MDEMKFLSSDEEDMGNINKMRNKVLDFLRGVKDLDEGRKIMRKEKDF